MKETLLSDEKVMLRAPEKDDLDNLFLWENDTSMWNAGNAVAPYSYKQLWDYIETYEADIFKSRQLRFVVTDVVSGEAVGMIDVFDFDPVNRHASVGILIDSCSRRKGYASCALRLLCRYCNEHIGMHTLTAVCAKENESGVALFKACGFDTCGCLRSWVRYGNTYSDAIILQKLFS